MPSHAPAGGPPRILAFAGSLRAGSYNKKLVAVAAAGARAAGATVTMLDLRELPLPVFDEDLEASAGLHANARKLKDLLLGSDGFLISSPEYNSSVSAALKNMIDWTSRPVPGEKPMECWTGKVAGIMAASPGNLGGLRGLVHLRMILANIGVLVVPDQIAVSKASEAFDESGALRDARQKSSAEAIGARVASVAARLSGR